MYMYMHLHMHMYMCMYMYMYMYIYMYMYMYMNIMKFSWVVAVEFLAKWNNMAIRSIRNNVTRTSNFSCYVILFILRQHCEDTPNS